jgi:citrate synthase
VVGERSNESEGGDAPRLTAAEAAARLGVKPATLYAYVSRGLLISHRAPNGRGSSFDASEVERLARRGRRAPIADAAPGLYSALTEIVEGGHAYRGQPAAVLARTRTFEEVAEWLWSGAFPVRVAWRPDPMALLAATNAQAPLPRGVLPAIRLRLVAVTMAAVTPMQPPFHPRWVMPAARGLLAVMVDALPALRPELAGSLALAGDAAPSGTLAARLWTRLCAHAPEAGMLEALNAVLVLLADHGLARSTAAARHAASLVAEPFAAVEAGMVAASGATHGAASIGVERLLKEAGPPAAVDGYISDRLQRGEAIPGFGHARYRAGDSRATTLLGMLRQCGSPARLAVAEAVLESMRERGLPPPNAGFALAALANAAGMIPGAGGAIFAVARTAGWIAHALEEYARPERFSDTRGSPAGRAHAV